MRASKLGALKSGVAALSLVFTGAGATLDPRITFSRASTATFVGSNGLIQSAAINAPRFDYNPSTLAARGLLIEEQRTNLALWSSDLTNVLWVKTAMTTALTATGPDGVANSATTLTATLGNATALQTIVSASAARVTSAWIKRRTGSGVIQMTQDNGVTWTAVTVTAGWTQVQIPSATAANPIIGFRIVTNADAVDVALVNHEQGTFATSAIPTTTATVTRSADVASMTGTNFSSWYNASAGTFVAVGDFSGSVGALMDVDNSTTELLSLEIGTGTGTRAITTAGNVFNQITGPASTANAVHKMAVAYAASNFGLSVDGSAPATQLTGAVPSPVALRIGQLSPYSAWLNGHVQSITYYNTRKSNAELQALST